MVVLHINCSKQAGSLSCNPALATVYRNLDDVLCVHTQLGSIVESHFVAICIGKDGGNITLNLCPILNAILSNNGQTVLYILGIESQGLAISQGELPSAVLLNLCQSNLLVNQSTQSGNLAVQTLLQFGNALGKVCNLLLQLGVIVCFSTRNSGNANNGNECHCFQIFEKSFHTFKKN